ncbi:MAG TPA: M67 family metallopeptidase [Vicinamibacterales bacterium]|nr:M67 family metallopeptidase [Vicinamibacterales bacterium]
MEERVRIARGALRAILAHARAAAPDECCGLLVGRPDGIERAVAARNLSDSRTRYLIDPRQHFAAIRAAREAGRAVVGFYHSHPSSAPIPSDRDLAEATYPDAVYLIAGRTPRGTLSRVRAFRLEAGRFREVVLRPLADEAVGPQPRKGTATLPQ